MVDVDDLIDAVGFAALLGLSHRNSIRTYRKRYPDFPEPVIVMGSGRCMLWVRSEAEAYARSKAQLSARDRHRSS